MVVLTAMPSTSVRNGLVWVNATNPAITTNTTQAVRPCCGCMAIRQAADTHSAESTARARELRRDGQRVSQTNVMVQHNAVAGTATAALTANGAVAGLQSSRMGTNPSTVTEIAMMTCSGQRRCWDSRYSESHS